MTLSIALIARPWLPTLALRARATRVLQSLTVMCCLTAVLSLHAAWAGSALGSGTHAVLIDTAEFSADDGHTWTAVTLPDTWTRRGLARLGAGRYRVHFDLTDPGKQTLGVVLTRISTFHRVSLNGALIAEQTDTPQHMNRRNPAAAAFDLPPSLLHVGTNVLEFELRFKSRSGLSEVRLASAAAAREFLEHTIVLDETLPRALNMATAGLALFMLAIWWRRRSEVALGAFGAMMLVAALRNYGYAGTYSLLPPWLFDWLVFSSQVVTTVMLGFLAQALGGTWRPFKRLLIVLGIILPAVALLAASLDHMELAARLQGNMTLDRMNLLRRFVYPVLSLISIAGLAMLMRHAWKVRSRRIILPVLGVLVLIACGMHDYAFQTGLLSVNGRFWLPLSTPLVMSGLAMLLVARLVTAISAVEVMNVDLDRRVALRTSELEAANAAKSRFLAAATHDLRQPVVTVGLLLGMAQDLIRESTSPARALIDRARTALDALESLLRDLLDLSRVESGAQSPLMQSVSLSALFQSTEQHVQLAAARKGLSVRFKPTTLTVRSDPVLLEQILRNLVDNAVRFTDRGGVLVSARRRGTHSVLLQVRDTGRGIALQHQGQIFEEFVQVGPTPNNVPRGTGLGLAIVRRAAAALGVEVRLVSHPGRGSCFSLRCARDQIAFSD